ncbi:hypothetical protein GMORB2_4537 [Geosmithia morbida]|uniref:MARVEL domain-containing protein n=1 Tax=Geosmithia morbida TaxID=1094350 RepID=A0A9P5CXT1_9HYPO|nr:uncharacterized protein GMORB2_4537 [Geosmithia morbida]KAF4119628.1 hypothetical protein GMORB2_4537 [Geosmithia morbida]
MGAKSGVALKSLQWFFRGIEFLAAVLILAVYSYFLATLDNHGLNITKTHRAVEGISGAGALYTLIGLILLCCLAGIAFFSFLAIVLDIAFAGAFIYVAWANRSGAGSCNGYLDTPFGRGQGSSTASGDDGFTPLPSFRTACRLQTACLAVAIISTVFFLISALLEVALVRHHRKAKRYGPGPGNDYTSGYGRKPGFFGRFRRNKRRGDAESESALPAHTTPAQLDGRQSYATDNTAHGSNENPYGSAHNAKYETGYGYPQQAANGYQYGDGTYSRT